MANWRSIVPACSHFRSYGKSALGILAVWVARSEQPDQLNWPPSCNRLKRSDYSDDNSEGMAMGLAGQERKPNLWKFCDLGYGGADQDVAAQVIVAQEAERRRFSREMHDDLAQKVALLEFQIEGMKRKLSPRHRASAELECLRGSVAMLAEDLHRICYRLHPVVLDNLGLVAGVEFLCSEFARTSGVKPKFIS